MASLVRGSWPPRCGAPRQGGSSIDPPIPLVLTTKQHEIDDDPLLFRELSTSYDGPLFSNFFDDAASFSCEQLIRSLKSGFSESHLRGRWCSSVFLPIDETSSKRSGLLFFFSSSTQLRRLSLISVPWSSASGPRRHSTRTAITTSPSQDKGAASGQQAAPSRPLRDPQGGCLWAADQTPHQGYMPTPAQRQPTGGTCTGFNAPECFPRSHLHAAQHVLKATTIA